MVTRSTAAAHDEFKAARDLLLEHRDDYEGACRTFRWPALTNFNWAIDWFDVIAENNDAPALLILEEDGREIRLSFQELAFRSSRLANYLRAAGVTRGSRVLMMLPNIAPLWEIMLACMKLGAVIIPSTPMLTGADVLDRVERGQARYVITTLDQCDKFAGMPNEVTGCVVAGTKEGWLDYQRAFEAPREFIPDGETRSDDPLLLYFTSGTSAKPKLVLHSQVSYPVGHLSTMYWLGLRPGDVHLNISSSGWAKHAWSCFFAPWNAEATVLVLNHERFDVRRMCEALQRYRVSSVCAPATVWRLLIQSNMREWKVQLREAASAGEPLNPEVVDQVRRAWGITVRDGYGQTETTAMVGNSPGQSVRTASMGRPLPGYKITLVHEQDLDAEEGEMCISLDPIRPVGLMLGYADPAGTVRESSGAMYRTGDIAMRDSDGWLTYVGRVDDVFKSSDYRISPFELESVLIEHEAIAEAAVIPAPDGVRLSVPKALVILAAGNEPSRILAESIFRHLRARLAPYKRVRRLEFVSQLPKTISGKIRRSELRRAEIERSRSAHAALEWSEADFLKPETSAS